MDVVRLEAFKVQRPAGKVLGGAADEGVAQEPVVEAGESIAGLMAVGL